jgi:hypothetical protein
MTAMKGMAVVVIAGLGLALACARNTDKPPNASGDSREQSSDEPLYAGSTTEVEGESTTGVEGDTCAERPCSMTSECCAGDVCGWDPGLSRVQRYCLSE